MRSFITLLTLLPLLAIVSSHEMRRSHGGLTRRRGAAPEVPEVNKRANYQRKEHYVGDHLIEYVFLLFSPLPMLIQILASGTFMTAKIPPMAKSTT